MSLANYASAIYNGGHTYQPLPVKDMARAPRAFEESPPLKTTPSGSHMHLSSSPTQKPAHHNPSPSSNTSSVRSRGTNIASNTNTKTRDRDCVGMFASVASGSSSRDRDSGGMMLNRRTSSNTGSKSVGEGSPASTASNSASQITGGKDSWTFSLGWHSSDQLQQEAQPLLTQQDPSLRSSSSAKARRSIEKHGAPLPTVTSAPMLSTAAEQQAEVAVVPLTTVTSPSQASSNSISTCCPIDKADATRQAVVFRDSSPTQGSGNGGHPHINEGTSTKQATVLCSSKVWSESADTGNGGLHSSTKSSAAPALHARKKLDMARLWKVLSIPSFRIIILQVRSCVASLS